MAQVLFCERERTDENIWNVEETVQVVRKNMFNLWVKRQCYRAKRGSCFSLQSGWQERRCDWLRKEKGVFQGNTEPRGLLAEEQTDRLKQSLDWLQREARLWCLRSWGSRGEKFERAQRGSAGRKVKKRTGRERDCQRRKIGTRQKTGNSFAHGRCILRGKNNTIPFRAKTKKNVE